MDDGEESIQHSAELAVVRRQARRVHAGAILSGAVLTALTMALTALL
jgi:hypothetical protein